MKRFVAATLLLGYVMLVPFCFFGGMLMTNSSVMNMQDGATHQMDDCGMLGGCSHSMGGVGMDTAVHHIGMYNSITQTPIVAFSMLFATLVAIALIAFSFAHDWLSALFAPAVLFARKRRAVELQNKTRQNILRWLSLFETSPNFA